MSPSDTKEQIDRLAWEIADRGMSGCADAVRRFVALARSAGLSGTTLEILADPAEPEIARARAFGLVAVELAGAHHRTARRPLAA